jgi:catechol-2,3-dioxygenase
MLTVSKHFAYTFDSLKSLLVAYRQRKRKGIVPVWCVNHGPTMSMYYRDTDGNTIETQADVFDNAEDANDFMKTEEFAINPLGVDFDPEELIEKLKKGEPEKELMKRPNIGPRDLSTVPLMH